MWKSIVGILPSGTILFCTFLSAVIPLLIYCVNRHFHQIGDPPWKKQVYETSSTPNDPKNEGSSTGGQQSRNQPTDDAASEE